MTVGMWAEDSQRGDLALIIAEFTGDANVGDELAERLISAGYTRAGTHDTGACPDMEDGMRDTGGHAFPNITPDMNVDGGPGMTLRDWFAGQALVHTLAWARHSIDSHGPRSAMDHVPAGVSEAYRVADAMLAERSKP